MLDNVIVVVQASSRSWQGGVDLCMNTVDGVTAVRYTAAKFLNASPNIKVIIAAPEFDANGELPSVFSDIADDRVSFLFAHDASPLDRLVEATTACENDQYIVRVDGLHFAVSVDDSLSMLKQAAEYDLDCIKFPDDFPVQLTSDVYRVGALRKLASMAIEPAAKVHPKFSMFTDPNFKTQYHEPLAVSDEFLADAREKAKGVYFIPRMDVNDKAIDVGNQLTFHYQLALEYLPKEGLGLDIACGDGYGTRLLAESGLKMTGGDIDEDVLVVARERAAGIANVTFRHLNVMDLDVDTESLNAVVSMETVEHVDDAQYLSEIYRVLKPGGRLILSTPQNSHGHIPVNAEHIREYSLQEIVALCEEKFEIVEKIGLKQGRVIVPGDPIGCNTVLVCQKPNN